MLGDASFWMGTTTGACLWVLALWVWIVRRGC